jgi:RNase P/RNase MRP subunit p29
MKKILFSLLIITAIYSFSSADEIYLNDLSIIKGKIIQVTDKNVEYSQEGKPLLIVPRDKVFKIKYDNGQVVQIAEIKGTDKIYLKDNSVIEGTITKVTADVIMYSTANNQEAVVRANVVKIVYADGKIIQIAGEPSKQIVAEKEPEPEKEEPPVIRNGGFLDSYIWFRVSRASTAIFGNLRNKEENAYINNRNRLSLYPFTADPEHIYTYQGGDHKGFELDLMLPANKYPQTKGFNLTGLKFGLKTTYLFSTAKETINDNSLPNDDSSSGRLLKYRSINAGPEINLVYSPRNDFFNMVFQVYLLGGYIHKGELTAVPALRDAGASFNESEYKANFTGYSGTFGTGINFVLNKGVPITIGMDFFYSYSKIEFDRSVPVYNNAKKASFDEIGLKISVGVHL